MLKIAKYAVRLEGSAALAVSRTPVCVMKLYKHSDAKQQFSEHVVTTNKKGDVILFWHPEKQIPYEHTQPMPVVTRQSAPEEDSPLLSRFKPETSKIYSQKGPTIKELCEMFYTNKHRFMPKPQLKRAKTDTPKDRNAL